MSEEERSFATKNVSAIALSAIKGMAMRASAIDDVASLTWGLPSFRTPTHIREAVTIALEGDPDAGKYTLPDGLPVLREAIAATHKERTGVEVSPQSNVIVTAGNMQGIGALLGTTLDHGDEVILTDPCFASHIQQIRLAGGRPVFWSLNETADWSVDPDRLERLITPRTRAVLLVSPSNPTGAIFAREDLLRVSEIAKRNGLLIILDDPYSQFCFDDESTYFDLASAREYVDHIAYFFTFSKCHAMSGWRLGYAIVPEALKRQMLKVHDAMLICAPRPSQIAGLAALTGDEAHLVDFRNVLRRRRSLICERLDRVPHVFSYVRPQGAYYVFPRIEQGHTTSEEFAIDLLERTGVCVTPGSAFGPSGESHIRMAFCVSDETIEKAFDRIEMHFGSGG